jgi:hypothetical protein
MIIVFLKNKLISCDTIVPLLHEIQQRRKYKVYFIVPSVETENYIKKNIVLHDLMLSMGSISSINKGNVLTKIMFLTKLIYISFSCFLKKGYVFYFGKIGGIIEKIARINERRMFMTESDSFGFSDHTRKAETAGGLMVHSIEKKQKDFYGKNLLIFSEHFKVSDYNIKNKDVFYVGNTRDRESWTNYIKKESHKYLNSCFSQENLTPTLSIVYILTYFGDLPCVDTKNSMLQLFKDTLKTLVQEANGIPILIKPHMITDLEIVKKEILKYPEAKIILTDLHPAVLSVTAIFFIGNYYSTVFGDAIIWDIPTIEFTSYKSAVLKETKGGSVRPEFVTYFINNNLGMLKEIVSSLVSNSKVKRNNKIKIVNEKKNNMFFQLFD